MNGLVIMTKTKSILLTFEHSEDVDYINLVCRRKGTDLESYIINNFEWDDMPACLCDEEPSVETCCGCDWDDRCPDVVKE